MNKEFSFKNYVIYAFRYWLVIAICSVVGLGAGLTYGIISNRSKGITYEGQIVISGISKFEGDTEETTENQTNFYNTIKDRTLNALCDKIIRDGLYDELAAEWKELSEFSGVDAQTEFFKALDVQRGEYQVYVSFTQKKDEKSISEFSREVVNKYIAKAVAYAKIIEPAIDGNEKIIFTDARLKLLDANVVSMGIIKGSILGAVAGFVLSLIAMFAVYFIDRRITSYGDIAAFTGKRLLGVYRGEAEQEVCPLIDCELNGNKVLLVCGSENTVEKVSELYTAYAVESGHKALLVRFGKNASEQDTLGDFIKGKDLSECVAEEYGASVLCGEKSWRLLLKNSDKFDELKKEYGRIVLSSPYYGDGSLGVFSSICDRVVFAIDQSSAKIKDVGFMVQELQSGDKAAGTVIEKAGRSFVGGKTYFETAEEEY